MGIAEPVLGGALVNARDHASRVWVWDGRPASRTCYDKVPAAQREAEAAGRGIYSTENECTLASSVPAYVAASAESDSGHAALPLSEDLAHLERRAIIGTRTPAGELARARATQGDPAWRAEYRATRPKVERKIGHLVRRRHGGRTARVRGTSKVAADFALLAAAANLARLAVLRITRTANGRALAPA